MRQSHISDPWPSSKTLKSINALRCKSGLSARIWLGHDLGVATSGCFLGRDVGCGLHSRALCRAPGRGSPPAWWLQGSFPEREVSTTWWTDLPKTNRPHALSPMLNLECWRAEMDHCTHRQWHQHQRSKKFLHSLSSCYNRSSSYCRMEKQNKTK